MLAQGEVYDDLAFVSPDGEDVFTAIAGKVSQFQADYRAWMAGGPADLTQLRMDLDLIRERLRAAPTDDTLTAALADAEQLEQTRQAMEQQSSQWGTTWDTLARWLGSLTSVFGMGVFLIPVGITIAVAVSAIAALTWIVTTWQDTRARTNVLLDMAERVSRGELSAEQAKTLLEAEQSGGGFAGMFAGIGTAGLVVAAVVVFLVVRR